ncbi:MAG: OmpA family protein [Hahellaceae bacterium]|nr:OmpA family protein [Hahellaceae bacterium]MCP5210079.1 OmpA family protein [Hahellaceae bacterium]
MKIIKKRKTAEPGASWIMTFADLMTLLLTFFILLLSFSNIDADKYKMIAQSMAVSFGVSWIQGNPPPTVQSDISVIVIPEEIVAPPPPEETVEEPKPEPETFEKQIVNNQAVKALDPNVEKLAENLIQKLETDIASNSLSVSYDNNRVMVRFSEEASFSSGSSELKEEMDPILTKIIEVLAKCEGDIIVSGYTDDRPITSGRFRSNWDLSAARAVSVVHQLTQSRALNADRIMAAGHADSQALVPNDSNENRAKNRRVEMKIFNPDCASPVSW